MRQERRLRSIPPLGSIPPGIRGEITIHTGKRGSLGNIGGLKPRESWRTEEQDWERIVAKHVYQKPPREKPKTVRIAYEERIRWMVDIVENYDVAGELRLKLQFPGIDLTQAHFKRGRKSYGPECVAFYSQVGYDKKRAFLILSTFGDIFESQVVPIKRDLNPFFKEELYLPQLAGYNPASMTVSQNNNLIVVSYARC